MDIQDAGLTYGARQNEWAVRAQAERRRRTTDHIVSIPSGLVLELLQAADDLREIAGYVEPVNPSGTAALRLRIIASMLKAIAETANT